jgi:hypothetical protein
VILGVRGATPTWASLAPAGFGAAMGAISGLALAIRAGWAYLVWLEEAARPRMGGRGYLAGMSEPVLAVHPVRADCVTNNLQKVVAYCASLCVVMIPANAPRPLFLGAVLTALAAFGVELILSRR